jgi:alkylhydroperoxidase family enzyme
METVMSARIQPAPPPYTAAVQAVFDRLMTRQGVAPLALFTTLARDERLYQRFRDGGLLDKGHLTIRQREIVIDRITALSGSEYEWGVHVAFFAERAGLDAAMQRSLVQGDANDPCWRIEDQLLIRACDQLHFTCDVDDELWDGLSGVFSELALMEILLLAGFYRTVSYLTNALRLPLEGYGARFPARSAVQRGDV